MTIVAFVAAVLARSALLAPLIVACSSTMLARRWRSTGVTLGWVSAALYAPFGWLVPMAMSDPGDAYRLTWLDLWPILPGLVPGALLFHPRAWLEFSTMGAATSLLLVGLTWLGWPGGGRRVAAVALALLIAAPTSWIAYALYRA